MKHVLVTLLIVPLMAAAVLGLLNWFFRRRGSDFSLLVSVVSQWLVAYLAWTLITGVVQSLTGLDEPGGARYLRFGFLPLAAILGTWQYRLARAGATRQAARVFLWGQMVWLLLLVAEHAGLW